MFIDPHVHFRDEAQSAKETIAHGLAVAEAAGFTAVIDMPNAARIVDSRKRALERLALVPSRAAVKYYLYLGLTADTEQVRRAVHAYNTLEYHGYRPIAGFKLYAGHSTGDLGVFPEDVQFGVYRALAEEGYDGVLVVHCEKESLMRKHLDGSADWDPRRPVTHAYARPPESETESVKDLFSLAKAADYEGKLHVGHVSVPESVRLVRAERELRVTCGVCPHHLMFDYTEMEKYDERGLLLKMNPPLRAPGMDLELLAMLRDGLIDWIETDHAPHTRAEKLSPPYLSGVPGLHFYPRLVEKLRGGGFSDERIREITFDNANRAFGLGLERRACAPSLTLDPYPGIDVYRNV